MAKHKRPTLSERVRQLEGFVHDIYFASSVEMNSNRVSELLDNAARWSFAHRCGNGELSDAEQNRIIDNAFHKLRERKT